MRRVLGFLVSYNGLLFYGYQRQPDKPTVESAIFSSFEKSGCMDGESLNFYSYGGRTDRGVSALGQIFTISPSPLCEIQDFIRELEKRSVRIWGIREGMPPQFHARHWALWRDYVYIFREEDISIDHKCSESIKKELHSRLDFSFLYKGSKIAENKRYMRRRILKFELEKEGEWTGMFVRGETYPFHFVRRLASFVRDYDCSRSFEENIQLWRVSEADPENLILFRVKIPYQFKRTIPLENIAEELFKSLFKTTESDLPSFLKSFLSLSWPESY
ncbi:hypothetical protein [Fervidicoccus fontis]|uniref:hypothetical protein n=1 Tax=Fervidicoccus fontis TaxID=683846 RepID=UPI0011E53CBB|nr:hypothetical protein [Fervidicoccus fontis]